MLVKDFDMGAFLQSVLIFLFSPAVVILHDRKLLVFLALIATSVPDATQVLLLHCLYVHTSLLILLLLFNDI